MKDFFSMIRGWATGRYRVFPWRSLLLFGALMIYGFSPVDLIPDFIPGVGFIDDVALLGFLFRSLVVDTRKFREWQARGTSGADNNR